MLVIDDIIYHDDQEAFSAIKPPTNFSVFSERLTITKNIDDLLKPACKNERVINGKTYYSIVGAYNDLKPDIPFNAFKHRYKLYLPMPKLVDAQKAIIIDHVHYFSISDAYRKLNPNVSLVTFTKRVKKGLPVHKLIEPIEQNMPTTINGQHYGSMSEAYKDIQPDMSQAAFFQKVKNNNFNLSTDYWSSYRQERIEIDGFVYDNAKAAYDDLEPPIDYRLFQQRLTVTKDYNRLMKPRQIRNAHPKD